MFLLQHTLDLQETQKGVNFNVPRHPHQTIRTCRIWSPGEGGYGEESEQELEAVEAEQDGAEEELQPQDEGLQQQVVNSQRRTGNQDEERRTRGQRALTQVPLPA